MSEWMTTTGELLGAVLIAVGVGFVCWPAGIVVAGLFLIGLSYLAAEQADETDPAAVLAQLRELVHQAEVEQAAAGREFTP